MIGVDLRLDVEAHMAVTRFAYQRDDFCERWNARTRHGALLRKLCRIGSTWADLADVVSLDVFEAQLDEGDAGPGNISAIGATGEVGIEPAFMRYDDRLVLSDAHIEFKRVHT